MMQDADEMKRIEGEDESDHQRQVIIAQEITPEEESAQSADDEGMHKQQIIGQDGPDEGPEHQRQGEVVVRVGMVQHRGAFGVGEDVAIEQRRVMAAKHLPPVPHIPIGLHVILGRADQHAPQAGEKRRKIENC